MSEKSSAFFATIPPVNFRGNTIGMEYELLGVFEENLRAIPYDGERSLCRVLKSLINDKNYEAILENGNITGLKNSDFRITIEPGSQIELSSGVHFSVKTLEKELRKFLDDLREASAPFSIKWLPVGFQPVSAVSDIVIIPKERYRIMNDYLPSRGRHALKMMRLTGGLHAGIGYQNIEDAEEKYKTANSVSSFACAMFANSPFSEGAPNGYESYRTQVWLETDGDRCGFFESAVSCDFRLSDYVDYALRCPMLFIVRGGQWIEIKGQVNFSEFRKNGFGGYSEENGDWEHHLSTLFPEARLRQGYIEVRSMDSVEPALALSAVAFWRGVLCDENARKNAFSLTNTPDLKERLSLHSNVAKNGLNAIWRNRKILDIARELFQIAESGLKNIAPDDILYLAPLKTLLDEGLSPATKLRKEKFFPSQKTEFPKKAGNYEKRKTAGKFFV